MSRTLPEQLSDFLEFVAKIRPPVLMDKTAIIDGSIRNYINRLESILLGATIGSSLTKEEVEKILGELMAKGEEVAKGDKK